MASIAVPATATDLHATARTPAAPFFPGGRGTPHRRQHAGGCTPRDRPRRRCGGGAGRSAASAGRPGPAEHARGRPAGPRRRGGGGGAARRGGGGGARGSTRRHRRRADARADLRCLPAAGPRRTPVRECHAFPFRRHRSHPRQSPPAAPGPAAAALEAAAAAPAARRARATGRTRAGAGGAPAGPGHAGPGPRPSTRHRGRGPGPFLGTGLGWPAPACLRCAGRSDGTWQRHRPARPGQPPGGRRYVVLPASPAADRRRRTGPDRAQSARPPALGRPAAGPP